MNNYSIRQINADEYETVRQLDSDAFGYNERGSDGKFHRIFADNIRRSPYFIPKLDLVAVTNEGFILGHGIFSALPMGDAGNHVVWLNSLAIRHGKKDNHTEKKYEYQRKGIGTAIVKHGLEVAKSLGFTACMTCGNPTVYQRKMGFKNYRELGIKKDDSVEDPAEAVFAIEVTPAGFDGTNRLLSYLKRLSDAGYDVTGMNYSKRSIAYAEEHDTKTKYIYLNYLEMDYTEAFDVITLIYCDYAALIPDERKRYYPKYTERLSPTACLFLTSLPSKLLTANVIIHLGRTMKTVVFGAASHIYVWKLSIILRTIRLKSRRPL